MRTPRIGLIIVLLIVVVIIVVQALFVVDETKQAIILQFGESGRHHPESRAGSETAVRSERDLLREAYSVQ